MSAQPHVPVLNAPQPNCEGEMKQVCQQMDQDCMRKHMEMLAQDEEEAEEED